MFTKDVREHLADEKKKESKAEPSDSKRSAAKKEVTESPKAINTAVIWSTTDYSSFKHINSNREVDKKHVNKLAEAIRKKNLLHLNPIVVNAAMEIIDGQHRLEAAKS